MKSWSNPQEQTQYQTKKIHPNPNYEFLTKQLLPQENDFENNLKRVRKKFKMRTEEIIHLKTSRI